MAAASILGITRIGLTVRHLARASAFFQALGFAETGRERRGGPAFAALMGEETPRAEVCVMRLGGQAIELCAFDAPGAAYPQACSAADPWFQHFAVVVGDMDAAFAAAEQAGAQAISAGGPVLLPPQTGAIRAWKFRDPEGHPLELSWFPQAVAPAAWRDPPAGRLFLGVDHSAVAVFDPGASAAFYEALGMRAAARQVNVGPTQDRLDGLPDAEVEIVSLDTAAGGPHMELLAYRRPAAVRNASPPAPRDIAATRLVMQVSGLASLLEQAAARGGRVVSAGIAALDGGSTAALVRDPDGHLLEFREPGSRP